MKIAISGKGGVGKTLLSSLLSKIFSESINCGVVSISPLFSHLLNAERNDLKKVSSNPVKRGLFRSRWKGCIGFLKL